VRAHCLTAQRAEEQDHDQRLAKKIIFYSFSIESPTFLHASIFSPSIDSCNVQSDAQTHSLSLSLSLSLVSSIAQFTRCGLSEGATYLRCLTLNKLSVLTASNHAQLFFNLYTHLLMT